MNFGIATSMRPGRLCMLAGQRKRAEINSIGCGSGKPAKKEKFL
jgi:hypothetical protein